MDEKPFDPEDELIGGVAIAILAINLACIGLAALFGLLHLVGVV